MVEETPRCPGAKAFGGSRVTMQEGAESKRKRKALPGQRFSHMWGLESLRELKGCARGNESLEGCVRDGDCTGNSRNLRRGLRERSPAPVKTVL